MNRRVLFSRDPEGNDPIDEIHSEEPIKIGESKDLTVWLQNLGKWTLIDLVISTDSDEIEIIETPKQIPPFSSAPVKLRITPKEPESEEDEKPVKGTITVDYGYIIK